MFSRSTRSFPPKSGNESDFDLAEILASVSAAPTDPDERMRILEDRIRRQWSTLQELVREHAMLEAELALGRRRVASSAPGPQPGPASDAPASEPRLEVAASNPLPAPRAKLMVPPPRRLRPVE